MKKRAENKFGILTLGVLFMMAFGMMALNSCGSNAKTEETAKEEVDDEAFYKTQPVESGLYDADYYDIVGKNSRKGKFDGRIYFSLSPKTSAINVFENGNRTKIDYLVVLQKPFEKNDSGVYCTVDMKDNPVCVVPDSTYCLKFIHSNDTVSIAFSPTPRHTGSAIQILEKINERRGKK